MGSNSISVIFVGFAVGKEELCKHILYLTLTINENSTKACCPHTLGRARKTGPDLLESSFISGFAIPCMRASESECLDYSRTVMGKGDLVVQPYLALISYAANVPFPDHHRTFVFCCFSAS